MTLNNTRFYNLNSSTDFTYTLLPAALEDAYEIWTVMDIASRTMEYKEHFICDDLEYVKNILTGHGFGVVARDSNGKIVGNLLVKYPGLDEENLGYDVFNNTIQNTSKNINQLSFSKPVCPIPSTPENLLRVVLMDSASVLPEHRGHHLESRMIAFAETFIDTSKYIYSFATVAPENTASLKSLKQNEYQVMVTKEKYGGLMRCVMMKILV